MGEPTRARVEDVRAFLSRLFEAFVLAPSDPQTPSPQNGFMADAQGSMRSRLEAVAAPALLATIFLLMSAFVIARSLSGG